MVSVSQTVNVYGIQTEVAEQLGIENFKVLKSKRARANKLGERLGGRRRILVVVDDIWEELNLEEDLGITLGNDSKGCTVLLTSRTEDVLKGMNVEIFGMDSLSNSEAWSLFRKTAGTCVDDQSWVTIAQRVVNECNGLPIAIVTVGSALKDKELPIWEDALHRLQSLNMPQDMKKKAHIRLRLSYDFLKDPEAESLFLLCSLFPEDSEIDLRLLAWYSMELNLIGGISNMEQARNRVFAIAKKLKCRFLLLDGYQKVCVKMHDLIRDMAIYIAKERRLVDPESGSRGHCDMDSKGIFLPGGSNQCLDHLMQSKSPANVVPESRKDFEDEVMKALRQETPNTLGICGMDGIGKTTMALRILRRAREEHLFDETLHVAVYHVDVFRIQQELAAQLGCNDLRNLDKLEVKANKLSSRLYMWQKNTHTSR